MTAKKPAKSAPGEPLPRHVLDKDAKNLDFYRDFYRKYKEISDIAEKIDAAIGRKIICRQVFRSTKDCEINPNAIPPAASSYKI